MPTWTITLADKSTAAVTATQCVVASGVLTFRNDDDNITTALGAAEWRKVEMTAEATEDESARDRADERLILSEVARCGSGGEPLSSRGASAYHLPKHMQTEHDMEFHRADRLMRRMIIRGDLVERQHGKRLGLTLRVGQQGGTP